MSSESKPNYFVRFLIFCLCLFLGGMASYRFIYIEPKGSIDSGMIFVLCLLIVLVLAEAFDSFSIGTIVSISREIKKKDVQIEKLERQNESLVSQMITVSSAQKQSQSHLNVYGDYHVAPPTVTPATPEEVALKESSEISTPTGTSAATEERQAPRDVVNWRAAEAIALDKYIGKNKIIRDTVIAEAKLTNQFDGVDPISNHTLIFDAYVRNGLSEAFVEFRPEQYFSPMSRDRLYVMLSKVNHYRSAKKTEAFLELVIMKLPDREVTRYPVSRLLEYFSPAIASGLLRVSEVEFSEDDLKAVTSQR